MLSGTSTVLTPSDKVTVMPMVSLGVVVVAATKRCAVVGV
jgi:hypothetical protein